ncbi:AGAP010678-PA-like protein [Anopheles sinensis]|uniref:AGAP010678-PA-like protein n=1 Tax=Anopheles sinensis TaxID=74873 RepID=A0A084WUG3_ANOSI|nr:AGAP010678-PA-like protein [Anopheles sinensis]
MKKWEKWHKRFRAPRTLELFVESLLTKTLKVTNARNAKTLSPSHMKQCIISESRFDFLRDLVKNIPDIGINEDLSGSEAGYGAEGTSPASTSTSSSSVSFSNGGNNPAMGGTFHHQPHYDSPTMLQRSESYSPASATTMGGQNSHHHPKRQASVSQTASLNFYKEIPLEGTSSPPPPKLTRLNSAPAGGAPATTTTTTATVPRLPFKIDILPNLPPAGTTPSTASKHTTIGAITPQISYKFERLPSTSSSSSPTAATTLEPVIKLDYSNVKLPTSSSAASSSARGSSTTIQPTIKIDLSSLATASFTSTDGSTTPTTPKQLASTSSSKHHAATSSSTSSTPAATTPIIQSPLSAAAAPPIYSAMSSTIPGMDEDYDDI